MKGHNQELQEHNRISRWKAVQQEWQTLLQTKTILLQHGGYVGEERDQLLREITELSRQAFKPAPPRPPPLSLTPPRLDTGPSSSTPGPSGHPSSAAGSTGGRQSDDCEVL
mmetsp:Transcript_39207/g.111014  ORF Transcript_39207/g.111014 Transcript_39207/m.111014 type:complete len:111 (+) Transcript_39207:886-1218(+)